eukprot:Tbor_TRINITY_DN5943_c0_g1::TRINITY_DN5943_c0_g1_i5::g.19200::m.19200/K03031/PSMD8, RPN12; 26S proteasome regulatory subunit N12
MSLTEVEMGGIIAKAAASFQKFRKANETGNDDECMKYLTELKRYFIQFPTFLNPVGLTSGAPSPTAQQEIILIRETLEHAVLFCARTKNMSEFETYFLQLRVYYNDFSNVGGGGWVLPPSALKTLITGLNLVRLLVTSRTAEFHSVIEKIPIQDRNTLYIKFPIQLQRYLMEGSYNKLLHARTLAPCNEFVPVVEMLESTVRSEVLGCIPKSYAELSVAEAAKMLMISHPAEMDAHANRLGWNKDSTGTKFVFQENTAAAKKEVVFSDLLANQIRFASELQRIV